jgi:predicted amidohydrolase
MQDLKVTIIQAPLKWEDKSANLYYFENEISAITEDSDLIVLPEMFNTAFSMKPELFAEAPMGQTHQWMQRLAFIKRCSIAGSYMVNEQGQYFNRFMVMSPNGDFQTYNKRHLFRMGNEHHHFTPGSNSLIFKLKGWKIKALICYDLRFPVFSKNNLIEGEYDYDALIYVANWPKVRNRIWLHLLTARALENQAFVIGVNRIGEDGHGLDHAGGSCVINSKGEYIVEPIDSLPLTTTARLSYADLKDFRNKFTVGLDWDTFEINPPSKS